MNDWSKQENDLIVADYFSMLIDELEGRPINKSRTREALIPLLNGRTDGSVEFKRQNISAWLAELGRPYIKGYIPRNNKQISLLDSILEYLRSKKDRMEVKFRTFSDQDVARPMISDFSNFLLPAPEIRAVSEAEVSYHTRRPFKINYLEREQRNSSLGEQGEKLVIEYEKWQLINAGKKSFADKIEWISRGDDGAGFDILSRNLDGTDKYIEVKTTKLTKEAPFFFSKGEFNFSKEKSANFHLYRVFQFTTAPKMFQAQGAYDTFCSVEPVQFKGSF